jgi:glutamate N-acetyltransferase/amino-acid N-acetyltransferase
VCRNLAIDIVRNGEGTEHVIRVIVSGGSEESILEQIGKAVVNSPLVKAAIFGNDPNVGRIVCAIGDFLGNFHPSFDTDRISITLGGTLIFDRGEFKLDSEKEKLLSRYLSHASMKGTKNKRYPVHDRFVDIEIATGPGDNKATVFGSDLSYDYVKENADYRT